MLVDINLQEERGDVGHILDLIAAMHGHSNDVEKLSTGVYQVGHFNFETYLGNYDYTEVGYGVCDNYQQVIDCYNLNEMGGDYVLAITPIYKSHQSESGGWRWHKWGKYIGVHEITQEYLYDEPVVELVYCFTLFQVG